MKIETIENGVMITIPEKENYTLSDLRQKLINYLINKLNNQKILNEADIDLIKVLFD